MTLYNASSRARNATSTINQNSGGGNKKAGLYPLANTTANVKQLYRTHGIPRPASVMQMTLNPNVCQSRPGWVRPGIWMKC